MAPYLVRLWRSRGDVEVRCVADQHPLLAPVEATDSKTGVITAHSVCACGKRHERILVSNGRPGSREFLALSRERTIAAQKAWLEEAIAQVAGERPLVG